MRRAARAAADVPVYQQLYLTLRQRIRDGMLPPDRPLPAEPRLAAENGVARVTVRRALSLLEQEGLVERRRGAGTWPREAPPPAALPGPADGLTTLGLATHARTLAHERAVPPPFAAAALGLAADAACLHIERLRLHAGRPFSLTNLWLPERLAPLVPADALGDAPVIERLEAAGVPSATAEQALSAVAADPRTAELLGTPTGAPLLRLRRTVMDGEGRPHLYQQSLYVPDRFEYRMDLARGRAGPSGWRQVG